MGRRGSGAVGVGAPPGPGAVGQPGLCGGRPVQQFGRGSAAAERDAETLVGAGFGLAAANPQRPAGKESLGCAGQAGFAGSGDGGDVPFPAGCASARDAPGTGQSGKSAPALCRPLAAAAGPSLRRIRRGHRGVPQCLVSHSGPGLQADFSDRAGGVERVSAGSGGFGGGQRSGDGRFDGGREHCQPAARPAGPHFSYRSGYGPL